MAEKVALLLDGGFVRPLLQKRLKTPASADAIEKLAWALLAHRCVMPYDLYRTFFYDCDPFGETVTNPISKAKIHLGSSPVAVRQRALLDSVELKPNFAVRRGQLLCHGWRLKKSAIFALSKGPLTLTEDHIEPHLQQKGVDQRVSLDAVGLAAKKLVGAVVLVVCDSDFVPVMKAIRREGLRVILFAFNQSIRPDLRAHSDIVIPDSEITI
jgi:uncharacterized LabA/DUF88 family protein